MCKFGYVAGCYTCCRPIKLYPQSLGQRSVIQVPTVPGRSTANCVNNCSRPEETEEGIGEEGESEGLPVWSEHIGDPILESNLTRRVDFALFMVAALEDDELVQELPLWS